MQNLENPTALCRAWLETADKWPMAGATPELWKELSQLAARTRALPPMTEMPDRVPQERRKTLLRMFPAFQDLPAELLARLARALYEQRPETGELVVTRGEPGGELFFVHSGTVEVLKDDGTVVAQLGRDQFFGELGLLLRIPRTASVRNSGAGTVVLVLTRPRLDAVLGGTVYSDAVALALHRLEQWWRLMDYSEGAALAFGSEFAPDLARQRVAAVFRGVGSSVIDRIAKAVEFLVLPPKAVVFKQGDDSSVMYFIVDGRVAVETQPPGSDSPVPLGDLTGGDFFGELGALFQIPRTATVKTQTSTHLFTLSSARLDELLADEPAARELIRQTAETRRAATAGLCASVGSVKPSDSSNVVETVEMPELTADLEMQLQYLDRAAVFRDAPTSVKRVAAAAMVRRAVLPGDALFRFGDPSDGVVFLANGQVEVAAQDGTVVATPSGPHIYFGEVGVLEGIARTATITALTPCTVYWLGKADLERMWALWPALRDSLASTAHERFQSYLMRDVLA